MYIGGGCCKLTKHIRYALGHKKLSFSWNDSGSNRLKADPE